MKMADFENMVASDLRRGMKMLRGIGDGTVSPTLGARQIKSITGFLSELCEVATQEGIDVTGYIRKPKAVRKPKATSPAGGGSTPARK